MENLAVTNLGHARSAASRAAFSTAGPLRLARNFRKALSLGANALYCELLFNLRRSG